MSEKGMSVAGVDVGTECVKVVVLGEGGVISGRAIVQTRGYFQERAKEALDSALDDAQLKTTDMAEICATGFGARLAPGATISFGETASHALGAWHQRNESQTIIDIGGREPRVIHVDGDGKPKEVFNLRQCAVGIGTFLMYAAHHLDVHPTRMQELASNAANPAPVGSYCSLFAGGEVLERLREGATREEVALGCMESVAERIVEIGGFEAPIRITGGVAEYFPGVLSALSRLTQLEVEAISEPIMTGSVGAALHARRKAAQRTP